MVINTLSVAEILEVSLDTSLEIASQSLSPTGLFSKYFSTSFHCQCDHSSPSSYCLSLGLTNSRRLVSPQSVFFAAHSSQSSQNDLFRTSIWSSHSPLKTFQRLPVALIMKPNLGPPGPTCTGACPWLQPQLAPLLILSMFGVHWPQFLELVLFLSSFKALCLCS